jgi:hypothetical protein
LALSRAAALVQFLETAMDWKIKCLGALAFVMLGIGSASAAGTAVAVDPEAMVRSSGVQQVLLVGADVRIGDLIETSTGGHAELAFDDGTKIVVGPGSALLIEDYLLRGDGSTGDFAISALGGTFRFISGKSAKESYRITTPTGTIGIRGTAFDLVTNKLEGARVLMYSGATELCPTSGECVVVSDSCELGEMKTDGASSLGLTNKFTREQRRELRSRFVYGSSQQPLGDAYRLQATARCLLSPMPFTADFFKALQDAPAAVSEPGDAPDGDDKAPAAPPAPGEKPPAKPSGPTDEGPDPEPVDPGGDCAGNSGHNPGNSQNCNKK